MRPTKILAILLLASLLLLMLPGPSATQAQGSSRVFPQTGNSVRGAFLQYWDGHGGLAQQGYPISGELQEASETDGKVYTVQYFERAVFELHPELGPTNSASSVLLSLLGTFLYKQKYSAGAPGQQASSAAGAVLSPQTGKHIGGIFLDYWQKHGGLAQQGYPISEEFTERSDLDGNSYKVQYFERAVFEYHPEKQPPYNVLLSQLGTFRYHSRYGSQPAGTPAPTPAGGCTSLLAEGVWSGSLQWGFTMKSPSLNGTGGAAGPVVLDVACDGSFTGTVQISSYSARVVGGNITVLTCAAPTPPIAAIVGRVESGPDGKRLNITGGTFKQGVTLCSNPIAPAKPTNLAGSPVTPSVVKIETEVLNKIEGSQWVPDANYVTLIEQFRQVYQDVQVVYSGHWELTRAQGNTP